MKKVVTLATLIGVVTMGAFAVVAADVVKERRALMKDVVSKNATEVANMIRGKSPYDAAQAADLLGAISGATDKFVKMFPDGTSPKENSETEAKADIWTNMSDFLAEGEKMKAASAAAAAAAKDGAQALRQPYVAMINACKSCHEKYSLVDL